MGLKGFGTKFALINAKLMKTQRAQICAKRTQIRTKKCKKAQIQKTYHNCWELYICAMFVDSLLIEMQDHVELKFATTFPKSWL